jgi:hypothetical protein
LGSAIRCKLGKVGRQLTQINKGCLKVNGSILPPCAITDIGVVGAADIQLAAVNGIPIENLPIPISHIPTNNKDISSISRAIQLVTDAEIAKGGVSSCGQPAFCIRGLINIFQQEYIEILGDAQGF